jgi:DNA-binding IclR family transcriptional regulator
MTVRLPIARKTSSKFARRQRRSRPSDLARELSLPTSTCFALVHTLVGRGFCITCVPEERSIRPAG